MMVIVPRIAAVSYLNTTPFLYGVEHEGIFRADLSLSDYSDCLAAFSAREADIALVPATAVPSLSDAQIVTPYCIGSCGASRMALLVSHDPITDIRRIFLDDDTSTSAQLLAWLMQKYWKIAPEYQLNPTFDQLHLPQKGDAFLVTDDRVFAYEGMFTYAYDLSAEWKKATRLPFAFAVWVAHKGIDPELIEGLQQAFTFGLERSYEALVAYGFDSQLDETYGYLAQIDYIFDNQKQKALKKIWDSGIKIAPRANPG